MTTSSVQADSYAHNEALHCSFDGRGSTDLVSNSTYLPSVELGEDLGWFFRPGGMPTRWLSSFLHEAVHHWCFHTVVGSALAGLQLRARLRVLESTTRGHDQAQDAIEDIVRFDWAIRLLRPIAEGLALFTEFDVMPMYHTPVISRPMTWAYLAFTVPSPQELKNEFGRSLNFLLQEMRFGEQFIRRKASVLLQPLAVGRGDYLVGYLTVKGLWQRALHASHAFGDADLFYTFLKRYFYSDFGLVAKLLQTRSQGPDAGKELLHYFGKRLTGLFFSTDWEREAKRLLASLKEPENDDLTTVTFPPIGTDKRTVAEGRRLLDGLVEYFQNAPRPSRWKGFRWFHYLTLAQRHLMRVASFPVELEPKAKDLVAIKHQGRPLFEERPVKDWKPVRTRGSLDLYISVSDVYRAATVSAQTQLVTITFQGQVSQARKDQFEAYILDREHADGMQEAFRSGVEAFIDTSGFRSRFTEMGSQFASVVDVLYLRPSLSWVNDEEVENCHAKMQKCGLLAIVDGKLPLLKSLAGLSLCASFLANENEAAYLLPKMEITVPEAMDALEACARRHGMPLIGGRGDKALNAYV